MSFRRSFLLVSLAAVLAPGAGLAADVGLVSRDVPVGQRDGALRSLAPRPAPAEFEMVGLHWQGSGDVWFRTAREPGAWSAWRHARPEAEDLPDVNRPEGDRGSEWKLGNPYWTGPSRFVQYRLSGRVTRLRAFFLRIPEAGPPAPLVARAERPAIVRRAGWGADESIVRGKPAYAERVRLSVVHHTAGTNRYTRAQAAGIVRGIQRYHVQGNGWNDIGYNFLVDKYGRVYEGRAGGIAANVVGAHAQGFNTGSVGVAVLGTYGSTRISAAARSAVQRLLAWRLDVAHVRPTSAVDFVSFGNERFPPGAKVRLRAVSGHRDTGSTSCPGTSLYGELPAIARAAAETGLPKLYDPLVSGAVGGPVRFTARLSHSRGWAVTVKGGDGVVAAEGRGRGKAVDWTWDSASAPFDRYTYVISSGAAVRPAGGVVPGPPPLATARLRAEPRAITPNGDRNGDRTRVSFSLSKPATVSVTVVSSGTTVKTLADERQLAAGPAVFRWAGKNDAGAPVADGRYRLRIEAEAGSERVVRTRRIIVDRTLAGAGAAPSPFSPNRDGRLEKIAVSYELTKPADVRVRVERRGRVLVAVASASGVAAGTHEVIWNGRLGGKRAADGRYAVSVRATTNLGTRELRRRFEVDTRRPTLRLRSARAARAATRLRIELDEPARVRVWYGDERWSDGRSVEVHRPAGTSWIRRPIPANVVRLRAWDRAENASRALVAQVRR